MLIYRITNKINGKVYIGKTTKTLKQRIKTHYQRYAYSDVGFKLYNAMRKYGWENFQFEEIAHAESLEELNRLEVQFIGEYDSIASGYNIALGGGINPMDSEDVATRHRDKMRAPETRQKISESLKKTKQEIGISEEHRAHISQALREFHDSGKKPNYKHPRTMTDSQKLALLKAKQKAVWCEDENGNVINEFPSALDGARWWQVNGYSVSIRQLQNRITQSIRDDTYRHGIRWHLK